MKGDRVERTSTERDKKHVEVVDQNFLDSLREVSRTAKGEIIYDCPWCEERYGPNLQRFYPKLYYNPQKQTGFCFRCGTVIFVRTKPSQLAELGSEDRLLPSLHRKEEEITLDVIEDLSLVLPLSENKALARGYLLSRSPYLKEVLEKYPIEFHLASFGDGEYGIVFPFRVRGYIVSYQIRRFRIDGQEPSERYTTREGKKIPYSPFGVDDRKGKEAISLVEGVFGTFGLLYTCQHLHLFSEEISKAGTHPDLLRLALRNPIATLGFNISETVRLFIQALSPRYVVVVMDSKDLSYRAVKTLQSSLIGASIDVLDIGDPDEFATKLYLELNKKS